MKSRDSFTAFGMHFDFKKHFEDFEENTESNVYVSQETCHSGQPYEIETDSDFPGMLRLSHTCQHCGFVESVREFPEEFCMYYPMEGE